MKKRFILSCLPFAAAMMTVFGCTIDELPEEPQSKVFTASIGADTKTVLDLSGDKDNFGKVYWIEGDEVSINGTVYVATPNATDATLAVLTKKNPSDPEPEAPYTACYPANNYSTYNSVPISQQYAPGADLSNVAPMIARSDNSVLHFMNLGALFEITIKGPDRLKVRGINFNYQELDCGTEGVALSEDGTKFYIATKAATFPYFDIKIILKNGVVLSRRASAGVTIKRNTINTLTYVINDSDVPDIPDIEGDAAILGTGLLELSDKYVIKSVVFNVNTDKTTDNVFPCPFGCANIQFAYAPIYYEYQNSVLSLYTSASCYIPKCSEIFSRAKDLESLDLTNFNFSSLETALGMFSLCPNLKSVNLRGADFSNVKSFLNMFYDCKSLESLDLTGVKTSSAENMQSMFYGCSALKTLDISSFKTSNVTDMSYMFYGCSSLEDIDVTRFDTRNVKTMEGMFQSCASLSSLDLTNFDISSVETMSNMFTNCRNLSFLDLSSFTISEDTELYNYFGATGLNTDKCIVRCTPDAYPYLYAQSGFGNVEFEIVGGDVYESTDYSADGKVVTLQEATEGRGINLILMGEAYSDRMIADGTYHSIMQSAMEDIFDVEPFKSLRHLFNVYEVDVVSKNEFVSSFSETAFDSEVIPHGTSVYFNADLEKVEQYTNSIITSTAAADDAIVVVLVNHNQPGGITYMYTPYTPTDYGSGMTVALIAKSEEPTMFKHVLQHECGHAIGKLADEYQYDDTASDGVISSLTSYQDDYGWYRNVSVTSDLTKVPWKQFVGDSRYASEGIGAYEGAYEYAYGIWRPTRNSMMREDNMCSIFNAPSRALIYYRVNKIAYGNDWEYDYEEFVKFDERNRGISFLPSSRTKASEAVTRTHIGSAPVVYRHK